ncbi:MAG: response regulator [Treponema sp.]|nr:response regulator [Treponema sp.]
MENTEKKEKNSILVVDDEKLNLEVLNNILRDEYTIFMTKSGSSAIDIANNYVPDLILLDIIMPDMNGFDVLKSLKTSEKTRHIPVIIITGLESVEDEEKGLALDAADFIHKPFSSKVVKSRVHNQIQIVNQIRALEQYAQIQAAVAAAEEKSKFFAKMSHEMRTPLNAVIGLSELTLEDSSLSESVRENVEKVCNAGDSLLNIVNDILDISKIEEGRFELVPVEYDTAAMIGDTINESIMYKGEKPVEFILNIDENIPKRLYGDNLRIRQILNNLLSNAFKYTKEGLVELKICFINQDDDYFLVADVRDTGIGIPPENVSIIFSDYSQMDLLINREIKGTGLGLSITKMITDLMKGEISVKSDYGKGSVFTVKLPQRIVINEFINSDIINNLKNFHYSSRKHNISSRVSRIIIPYARVLVVDDVLTNLDVAKGMMKPYRMQIDCVTSGQAAVDAIRNEEVRYNAIFMDHMMPLMNGIEATRIIREEIGTDYARNIPIIAFTANALTGNEDMFLSKGFQAFLTKPVDVQRLDAMIKQWVRNEEMEKNIKDQQIVVGGESVFDIRTGEDRRSGRGDRRRGYDRRFLAEKVEGINIHKGLERFSGDWDTLLQILKSFALNTKPVIESMKEVNSGNLADYAIIVHGVKSSCRGISAETAGNMAEALEKAAKAGDLDFVQKNNQALLDMISKLVEDLDSVFKEDENVKKDKPKKDKPYSEVLLKLNEACAGYAIDDIEKYMNEIEAFNYTADDGLAAWLRDNVDQMNYMEVTERISKMGV